MKRWQAGGWLANTRRVLSPNQGARPLDALVKLIVIHSISLPPDDFSRDAVEQFFVNRLDPAEHPYFATIAGLQVSAHFYIRRSGRIVQFVGCDRRAWHAGTSCWAGVENCNDYSVGVELQGNDVEPYTAAQYEALWEVIDALRVRYPIDALAGHCHIAPGRKTDPGVGFDWDAVRQRYAMLNLPAEVTG